MTFIPFDVVHLNANELPSDPIATSAGRGIYLVFWLDRHPIGHFHLTPAMLPVSPPALANVVSRALAAYIDDDLDGANAMPSKKEVTPKPDDWVSLFQRSVYDRIASRHALLEREVIGSANDQQSASSLPREVSRQDAEFTVSVVVCTRDRPDDLRSCLEHLLRCDPPADEIVVVDNASASAATREVATQLEPVRYIHESRQGLDIARNTGAQSTSGTIVAYTDDDVCVSPNWIRSIRRAFGNCSASAVTGLVLPQQLETRAQWIFETGWGFNRGYRPREFDAEYFREHRRFGVPAWEVGAGANMAFRREVFERIGFFDVRLDVGAAGCSGDSEYWYRIMAAGMTCRYDPSVVVQHRHRESMWQLKRQLFAYMRGYTVALLVQFERHHHWGNLARLCIWLPLYYMKRLVNRVAFGPTDKFESFGHELLGCLSGVLFYLRSITLDRRKWRQAQPDAIPPLQWPSGGGERVTTPKHDDRECADR